MSPTAQGTTQFYKLWYTLLWSVNEKQKIIPTFEKPLFGQRVDYNALAPVRTALWDNPEWIDEFVCENQYGELTEIELGLLTDWRRNYVKGRFYVMRHLKNYSVFMTYDEPQKLYGVSGITNPISEVIMSLALPHLVEAILLPFDGRIIYDSYLMSMNISFGSSYRKRLKSEYDEVKARSGIIISMSMEPGPVAPLKKTTKPKPSPPIVDTERADVPEAMSARYMEVAEFIKGFCEEKLNEEYKKICLKALAKLCRKCPSPLVAGKARTWACGIIYAVGSCNFIFDKSQPIYMSAADIADWFGLAKSTAASKSKEVVDFLQMSYMNHEYILSRLLEKNPVVWMLSINGYVVDIRKMPREVQVEAFEKGYIPYIPADKE